MEQKLFLVFSLSLSLLVLAVWKEGRKGTYSTIINISKKQQQQALSGTRRPSEATAGTNPPKPGGKKAKNKKPSSESK